MSDLGCVGFVGLGNIGKPMATRLVQWPAGLMVYDVAPGPLAELAELGASVADDLADLARRCDLVCVMVRDDAQVRDVVGQVQLAAGPGTVVVVHSTIAPDLPAELTGQLAGTGIEVLDAPVSGGAIGAAEGSLAIMVGGSEDAFAKVAEPLALMGSEVVHCGPVGAGTATKLARNLIHFVAFTAVGEASRLAEAAGIDLVSLGRIVRHTDAITGGPGAIMHRSTTAAVAPDDGWYPILDHVRALGEKDLDHAVALAGELGVDVPLARLALDRLGHELGMSSDHHEERQEK